MQHYQADAQQSERADDVYALGETVVDLVMEREAAMSFIEFVGAGLHHASDYVIDAGFFLLELLGELLSS